MEDVVERLTRVETKVEEHGKKLDAQVEKNDTLTKLTTLVEMQIEVNKEQGATLSKINDNLTNLNANQERLGERVSDIENTLHDQKKSRSEFIKGIGKYILTAIGGMIIAYLSLKLGLN